MDKIIYIVFFLLATLLISCKNKGTVYIAEKSNIVLIEDNGIIEGFTIHPHFTKYSCHIIFIGKDAKDFDTARIYLKSGDSLNKIENKLYGYFIFKKVNDELIVKYETSIIGCADWIFPKSNDENSIDTIKLKKIGVFSNPKIAFVKVDKQDKYSNLEKFFIIHDDNAYNTISINWEQSYFQMRKINVKTNDCVIVN